MDARGKNNPVTPSECGLESKVSNIDKRRQ